VKKLCGVGRPSDSCVSHAVVSKRNVAHRRMRTLLQWPKVVLLGGALEHQRSEHRLSSIETLIEQVRNGPSRGWGAAGLGRWSTSAASTGSPAQRRSSSGRGGPLRAHAVPCRD